MPKDLGWASLPSLYPANCASDQRAKQKLSRTIKRTVGSECLRHCSVNRPGHTLAGGHLHPAGGSSQHGVLQCSGLVSANLAALPTPPASGYTQRQPHCA